MWTTELWLLYPELRSSTKACATRRHQVWHETDRQAYGAILTQSGNNRKLGIAGWQQCVGWCEESASMCVCVSASCVLEKERMFEFIDWHLKMQIRKENILRIQDVHTPVHVYVIYSHSCVALQSETKILIKTLCLWPWSLGRKVKGTMSDICLLYQMSPCSGWAVTLPKKNVIVSPSLFITQSNHSLPSSSCIVQVAPLWEGTEGLSASINVLNQADVMLPRLNTGLCMCTCTVHAYTHIFWLVHMFTQCVTYPFPIESLISNSKRLCVLHKVCKSVIIGRKLNCVV